MKKVILIAVMLISVFSVEALFAQSHSGWWTAGSLGLGYYSGDDSSTKMVLGLDLPNVTVMHNDTGLFMTASPYHLESFCEEDRDVQDRTKLQSLVNLKLGLDLLKDDREWDLSPYLSLNWDPFKSGKNYRLEGGFDFTFFMPNDIGDTFPFRIKVATLNVGYGLRRGNTYFTAGISIDFLAFLYMVCSSELEKAEKSAVPAVASRGLEKPPVQPGISLGKAGLVGVSDRLCEDVREFAGFFNGQSVPAELLY